MVFGLALFVVSGRVHGFIWKRQAETVAMRIKLEKCLNSDTWQGVDSTCVSLVHCSNLEKKKKEIELLKKKKKENPVFGYMVRQLRHNMKHKI